MRPGRKLPRQWLLFATALVYQQKEGTPIEGMLKSGEKN